MNQTEEITPTSDQKRFARGHHPNSLAARALEDPELRRQIEQGRKEYTADRRLVEAWASRGFGPSIAPDEDLYGDQARWDDKGGRAGSDAWTTDEDHQLGLLAPLDAASIGEFLGRSEKAVRDRADHLGISLRVVA